MEQIAEHLYTVEIPLKGSPLRSIHCFLIKGEERSLMIDTAFNRDESEQAVLAFLEQTGTRLEDTDLFITHMHVDHSGLIARLKRPQNTVFASSKDHKLIDGFQNPEHWAWIVDSNRYMGVPPEHALKGEQHVAYSNRPSEIVEIQDLKEGDTLSYGGYTLRVIDLEGHSPGQIGLWDEENGYLFCGDHILGDISPNITAWDLDEDYLGIFLKNLQKVQKMPVKRLFCAHRVPPEDVHARIAELLVHHENRLEMIRGIIREAGGPVTAFYVASKMEWSKGKRLEELPIQQKWFAGSEALAHLQHLYFLGELDCAVDGDEVRHYSFR